MKYFSNGVSSNESVPQEGSATIRNSLIEENARSCWVFEGGVLENERGTERDTVRK